MLLSTDSYGKVAAEQEQGLCTGLSIIVRLDGLLTRAALKALLLIKQTKQIQNASLNLSYSLAESYLIDSSLPYIERFSYAYSIKSSTSSGGSQEAKSLSYSMPS
ncbi:hypothetical protein V6N11_006798 [Hibiscus sabdariffa]|uniref:Uncharacterized protein n=1 Tax=Hibiscus sabdariffa TaxID=183260 RepID=A0ABR2RS64_9ROSI